jgi:hypothetical protein
VQRATIIASWRKGNEGDAEARKGDEGDYDKSLLIESPLIEILTITHTSIRWRLHPGL